MTAEPTFERNWHSTLSGDERAVVNLISCLFCTLTRARLADILSLAQIHIDGKSVNQNNLKPLWNNLLREGILREEDNPGWCTVNPHIRVLSTIAMVSSGEFPDIHTKAMSAAHRHDDPYLHRGSGWADYYERWWALVFFADYAALKDFETETERIIRYNGAGPSEHLFFDSPFAADLIDCIPDPHIRYEICGSVLASGFITQDRLPLLDRYAQLSSRYHNQDSVTDAVIATNAIMLDRCNWVAETFPPDSAARLLAEGWHLLSAGQEEQALEALVDAQQRVSKSAEKRGMTLTPFDTAATGLLMLKTGATSGKSSSIDYMKRAEKQGTITDRAFRTFASIARLHEGTFAFKQAEDDLTLSSYRGDPAHLLLMLTGLQLCDKALSEADTSLLASLIEKLNLKTDLPLFAREIGAFVNTLSGNKKSRGPLGLCGLFVSKPHWEAALETLEKMGDGLHAQSGPSSKSQKRLAWVLKYSTGYMGEESLLFTPFEQTLRGSCWTKGKSLSWKMLSEKWRSFNWLTEKDRALCAVIRSDLTRDVRSRHTAHGVPTEAAIECLTGHEALFWDDDTPTLIEQIPVTLSVATNDTGSTITLSPMPRSALKTGLQWRCNGSSVTWSSYTKEQLHIAGLLATKPIIPKDAQKRLTQALEKIAPIIPVHADIELTNAIETFEGCATPVFLFTQAGSQFSIACRIIPHPALTPIEPGSGRSEIITRVKDVPIRIARDLPHEKQLAGRAIKHLDALVAYADSATTWDIDGRAPVLEMLSLLRDLGDAVSIQWKQGNAIRVSKQVSGRDCAVTVVQKNDWFDVGGTVSIGDDKTIPLVEILEKRSKGSGRFIPVDDTFFIELTEELNKQLDTLENCARTMKDSARISLVGLSALGEFFESVSLIKGKKLVSDILERFSEAEAYIAPIPSTCQATLRPYQEEGFRWLASRAQAGMGTCLADDMGLGKTIQIIALLLHRAHLGPALVVTPTSLCHNWIAECARFAPTLNCILYSETDRDVSIETAGAGTVILVSYGLLVSDRQIFTKRSWPTLVCDEAQAFKNSGTLRAQALSSLNADIRIAATGTPVENHLSELWSIFNIVNPGLLGSADQFRKRFAAPIEALGDRDASHRLRRIIAPFVLRRTKSEVLDELPPKTEIILPVTLSNDERALYETIRREAMSALDAAGEKIDAKDRISILAQLMRLRRSCCGRDLIVDAPDECPSKTAAVLEKIFELKDNGHRALVFSQFVDHLAILKKQCDSAGIRYQYLDGSTTPAARDKAVRAFQDGEGIIFLISLKAGGVGLNLTAADYVFHMDPWWNPAVEDQASDRVHRIGQTRPVTIYRLVTERTIEEKIVALHARKRELAEQLLVDQKGSAGMSADEFRELLAE